ncbi:MAG: hypothetical protein HY868_02585 [Chloroflexi bacterium]|nr:hypothetical protein [Chloroflexota bacterium]
MTTRLQCHAPLVDLPYVNGRKTIQTMTDKRSGAWELIPGPSTLREILYALTQVAPQEFVQEQQRVRTHRRRFRMHTHSAKQSKAQLKDLARRWKMLPADDVPK